MKHNKIICAVLAVCLLLLSLAGCAPGFKGNSVKTADSYILDIEALTGKDSHTLELSQGDTLQIQFKAEKGSLTMEIMDPEGESIYHGNGTEATKFAMTTHIDGTYTISVKGVNARGSIRVEVEKAPAFTAEDLVGPWHLEPEENDVAAIEEAFPGAMEFGSRMELTGDGKISWYIGIEGGSGTYTLAGDTVTADIVSDLEQQAVTVLFHVITEDETLRLEMDYNGTAVCWAYGDSGEPSAAGE